MGDLQRMTQFKEKSEGKEHVSTALFTYPVLMSADILLYKATVVPVGDDQLQHLELARETVRRFNHRFGPVFVEPQPRLSRTPRIMGLDGESKMSKSKGNTIALFDTKEAFWNKLRGAFTDPKRLRKSDPGRPEVCNIYTMHQAVSPRDDRAGGPRELHGGHVGVRSTARRSSSRTSIASSSRSARSARASTRSKRDRGAGGRRGEGARDREGDDARGARRDGARERSGA